MRLRAPRLEDATAIFTVLRDRDVADFGVPDCALQDLLEEWRASDFDLAADARVCEDSAGLVLGYASVRQPGTYAATLPGREAGGVERLLLEWSEQRQIEQGWERHRQATAARNVAAKAVLEDAGYALARSHWRMELALEGDLREPLPPAGVDFRPLDPHEDERAVYELDRASFAAVADAQPESMQHFAERHLQAHDFDASLSTVAVGMSGPVGFLLARRWTGQRTGFIDILAVLPGEQGRGIGATLLRRAFAMFQSAGLARAQLGVAADNPKALALYERVGMTPRFQIDAYERPVPRQR